MSYKIRALLHENGTIRSSPRNEGLQQVQQLLHELVRAARVHGTLVGIRRVMKMREAATL